MMPTVDTKAPVVRRERVRLVRRVDVEGLGRAWLPIRFESDVEYVRESETTLLALNAAGRTIKEYGTYSDYCGFLTSPREAMAEAPELAEEYAAFDGPLVVQVRAVVTDRPVVPTGRPCPGHDWGKRSYYAVPHDWLIDDEATAAHLAASLEESFDKDPTRLAEARVEHVVWTSKDGRDEGARRLRFAAFLDDALRGLPEAEEKVRASGYVRRFLGQVA